MSNARRVVAPTTVNLGRLRRMLRARPAAHHDIERKILHGRIEDLFDSAAEPVNLVDEEDAAAAQIGKDRSQIACLLDGRPSRHLEIGVHLVRHDVAERGLAQAGRPIEKDMVKRVAAAAGGIDKSASCRAAGRSRSSRARPGGRAGQRSLSPSLSPCRHLAPRPRRCARARLAAAAVDTAFVGHGCGLGWHVCSI